MKKNGGPTQLSKFWSRRRIRGALGAIFLFYRISMCVATIASLGIFIFLCSAAMQDPDIHSVIALMYGYRYEQNPADPNSPVMASYTTTSLHWMDGQISLMSFAHWRPAKELEPGEGLPRYQHIRTLGDPFDKTEYGTAFYCDKTLFDTHGFYAGIGKSRYRFDWGMNIFEFGARIWSLAILAAILPLVWIAKYVLRFVRWRRGRHRLAKGQCPECGYNRTGISGRCPECGASPLCEGSDRKDAPGTNYGTQ